MQCRNIISTCCVVRSLSFFTVWSFLSTNVELASTKVVELKVHNRNPIAATDVNRRRIVECLWAGMFVFQTCGGLNGAIRLVFHCWMNLLIQPKSTGRSPQEILVARSGLPSCSLGPLSRTNQRTGHRSLDAEGTSPLSNLGIGVGNQCGTAVSAVISRSGNRSFLPVRIRRGKPVNP